MGDKRVSTRTLPSGETCLHHPPDDQHPDGKLVLVRDCSPLRDKINDTRDEKKSRHDDLNAVHEVRINNKLARHKAKGLPPEKSPI